MSRRGVVILLIACAGGLFAGATGSLPFSEAVRVGNVSNQAP